MKPQTDLIQTVSQVEPASRQSVRHAAVVSSAWSIQLQPRQPNQPFRQSLLSVCAPALVSYSTTQLLSLPGPPSMQTSFPAPGCDVVTCLPAQWDRPCSNVFVHWRDYKETACQGQAAAVSSSLRQFGGKTAGCLGGEVARRPCCCSRAEPSHGPRPGRIRSPCNCDSGAVGT